MFMKKNIVYLVGVNTLIYDVNSNAVKLVLGETKKLSNCRGLRGGFHKLQQLIFREPGSVS